MPVSTNILKQIGLTDHEVSVYTELLRQGPSLASVISSKVNLNRTHAYDIIENLVQKGLIGYVLKNNKKYFSAMHPDKLIDYLQEKQKKLQDQEEKVKQIIPELLAFQQPSPIRTKVEIYRGKEGIKNVFNDILKKAKQYYVLGATGKISEFLRFYYPHHEKDRIKKKIKLKILFNDELRNKEITLHRTYGEVQFLPKIYISNTPTLIYNDRVAILIWSEPLAIVIESKEIADTYRNYFKLLWAMSSK